MQHVITNKNGNIITYKVMESGTAFHQETNETVCSIIEVYRKSGKRLKLYYGDTATGRDWCELYDTTGTIGRSTGSIKVPILLANSRSIGGGAILDHCIVRIVDLANCRGRNMYQHPLYHRPPIECKPSTLPEYTHEVWLDDKVYSRHKSERSANLLIKKLS